VSNSYAQRFYLFLGSGIPFFLFVVFVFHCNEKVLSLEAKLQYFMFGLGVEELRGLDVDVEINAPRKVAKDSQSSQRFNL